MLKFGVVILAAGAASRMGKAKMLLPFKNNSLLGHILQEVKAIDPACICMVTGKFHQEITSVIAPDFVQIVQNKDWINGMSGSIKIGLIHLLKNQPQINAVVFVVCDQPFLDRALLANMVKTHQLTGKGIVAANYQGINGTPVLFAQQYFKDLEKLVGDKGAKAILQTNLSDLATVDFPMGAMDIDTAEDYQRFLRIINESHVER